MSLPPLLAEVGERAQTIWPRLQPLLQERLASASVPVVFGAPPGTCQVLICGSAQVTQEMIEARPALTSLVIPHAGVGANIAKSLKAAGRLDIHVYNAHHNGKATGEMALALLMALSRKVIPADRQLRKTDWTYRKEVVSGRSGARLLYNGVALVLGYGAVGQHVARVLAAMGMKVMATRRGAEEVSDDNGVQVYPTRQLQELLPRCTALVSCLPLTDATRGLLGSAELALLQADCCVVNVGRAEVIDEDAIWVALTSEEKRVSFGADVWWSEPKESDPAPSPSRHDFGSLDNVVMTPHLAGGLGLAGMEEDRADTVGTILAAIALEDETLKPLDLSLGY